MARNLFEHCPICIKKYRRDNAKRSKVGHKCVGKVCEVCQRFIAGSKNLYKKHLFFIHDIDEAYFSKPFHKWYKMRTGESEVPYSACESFSSIIRQYYEYKNHKGRKYQWHLSTSIFFGRIIHEYPTKKEAIANLKHFNTVQGSSTYVLVRNAKSYVTIIYYNPLTSELSQVRRLNIQGLKKRHGSYEKIKFPKKKK